MNTRKTKELVSLGKRIAKLRSINGFTQDKLAELVNYSTNHIAKLELARTNPSFDLLVKLSNTFNINLKELFNFEDEYDIEFIKAKMHCLIDNSDETVVRNLYKIQENLKS